MDREQKELKLEELEKEVAGCRRCILWQNATNPVFGEGDPDADIMLVGEAPGRNEDLKGRPFVGKAGEVLDRLLHHIGLGRGDIYITSILKHRPPGNRDPRKDEIDACTPFLGRQIKIIEPRMIVCLGNFATSHIMKKYGMEDMIEGMTKIHGQVFEYKALEVTLRIIPIYHPAVVSYNFNNIEELKKDFEVLKSYMKNYKSTL